MPTKTGEHSDVQSVMYGAVGAVMPTIVGTQAPASWNEGTAQNEIQTLTVTGSPTGGTFTLTFGVQETGNIAYDATFGDVEAALEALSNIGIGNVNVTGGAGGPWVVTFVNALGNQSQSALVVDNALLTGGTDPDVTVAETQAGGAGGGTWTSLASVDADEKVKINWSGEARDVRRVGAARPASGHIVRVAIESIELTLSRADMASLQRKFPSFATNIDGTLELSAKNVEKTYIALTVETSVGVYELRKVAPDLNGELEFGPGDITETPIKFITYEDSDGSSARFHPFSE